MAVGAVAGGDVGVVDSGTAGEMAGRGGRMTVVGLGTVVATVLVLVLRGSAVGVAGRAVGFRSVRVAGGGTACAKRRYVVGFAVL